MNEKLYSKIDRLNEALKKSLLYKKMIKAENQMNESEEVKSLAKIKEEALNKYNEMVYLNGPSSSENEKYLKELHLSKKKLEEHKLVKKYLKYYSKYHFLLIEINVILFKDFKRELCQNKKTK